MDRGDQIIILDVNEDNCTTPKKNDGDCEFVAQSKNGQVSLWKQLWILKCIEQKCSPCESCFKSNRI